MDPCSVTRVLVADEHQERNAAEKGQSSRQEKDSREKNRVRKEMQGRRCSSGWPLKSRKHRLNNKRCN